MNDNILIDNLKSTIANGQLTVLNEGAMDKIAKILARFDSLTDYSFLVLSDAVEIKKNQQVSYFVLLSITYTFKERKSPLNEHSFSEYELIGIALLKKDYGRVWIRPETMADKINDWFESTDIDFDFNRNFRKKHYQAANNETKVRNSNSNSFLDNVNGFNELEIELDGNVLMARLRKPYTEKNSEIIASFIIAINDGIN